MAVIETSASETALFVPSTGNSNMSTLDRVKQVMSNALVGDFDNEIDLVSSEGLDGKKSSTSCFRRLFRRPTVRLCRPMVDCTIWVAQLAIIPS